MDEIIARLRLALASEAEAQQQADRVATSIDQARQVISRGHAQRQEMIELAAAALNDEVPDLQKISEMDRAIQEATAKIEVFSRRLELAQEHLVEQRRVVTGVLIALAEAHQRESQAAYDQACADFDAAVAAREATWRALGSAQRLRGADGDVLRTRFAEAVASARAA